MNERKKYKKVERKNNGRIRNAFLKNVNADDYCLYIYIFNHPSKSQTSGCVMITTLPLLISTNVYSHRGLFPPLLLLLMIDKYVSLNLP